MSLDVVVGHDGAREAVQTALQLPSAAGKLLIQYVALFRPHTRQLTLDRLATLLGELLVMIEAQRVRFDGQKVAAPQSIWIAALQDTWSDRDKSKTVRSAAWKPSTTCCKSVAARHGGWPPWPKPAARNSGGSNRKAAGPGSGPLRDTALGAVALLRGALTSQPPTRGVS